MSDQPPARPALRLIPGEGPEPRPARDPARPPVPDEAVEQAVVAVVSSSGGIPRGMLTVMVSAWLENRRPGEALPDTDRILRSLGMVMLRREVDVHGTALVPGPALAERAG